MEPIAIYGAGGFGREVRLLIEQVNRVTPRWDFIGFYDNLEPAGLGALEAPFLGGVTELNGLTSPVHLVVAIGDPVVKDRIVRSIDNKLIIYPVLTHPDVQTGEYQKGAIGEGTIITAGNILTVNYSIGSHVLLNLGCTVGHDAVIGDYSSLMPSVNVSGEVTIGSRVFIGTGAKIVNGVSIGDSAIIGAGAVVVRDIPAGCTAVGVPARPIKFHNGADTK